MRIFGNADDLPEEIEVKINALIKKIEQIDFYVLWISFHRIRWQRNYYEIMYNLLKRYYIYICR